MYYVIASGAVPDFKFNLDPLRDSSMSITDKERELSVLLTVKGAELTTEGKYDEIEPVLRPRKVLVASINHSGAINNLSFMLEGTLTNSSITTEKMTLAIAPEKGIKHYRLEYFFKTGEGIFSET